MSPPIEREISSVSPDTSLQTPDSSQPRYLRYPPLHSLYLPSGMSSAPVQGPDQSNRTSPAAMKFLVCLLLSALTLLVSALPVEFPPVCLRPVGPSANPACTGGYYDTCIRGRACVMSYPASCICANSIMVDCASACGVPTPSLANCGGLATK